MNICIDSFSSIKLKNILLYNIIKAYIERYAKTINQDQKALDTSASLKTNQNPNPKADLGTSANYIRTNNLGKYRKRLFYSSSNDNFNKKQKTDSQDQYSSKIESLGT